MKRPGIMIREVIRAAMHKPLTRRYPFDKPHRIEKFRGKLDFDAVKCIGCNICSRDCPSNAIKIRKIADKKFECDIDLARCIYCAQCVDSCPKKSLVATEDFELAQLTRTTLKVTIQAKPGSAPAVTAAAAAKPATSPATATTAAATPATPTAPAAALAATPSPAVPAAPAAPVAQAAPSADKPKGS